MKHTFQPGHDPKNTNFVLDLRDSTNHPTSLLYSELYKSCLVNALPNHGRSQPGFSLDGKSPFVLSAKKAIINGLDDKENSVKIIRSVFDKYYEYIQANNASEWLGLKKNKLLNQQPPWGAVFPWRARSIESYRLSFEKAAIEENIAIGYQDRGIEYGWLFNGPVSDIKIQIESERMAYVLYQIYENGYQRSFENDGDARATALVNEVGEWRWILTAGNHRASAATALGFTEIPIRINLIIKRSDYQLWPQVVDGVYSKEEALYIFDSLFHAHPPSFTTKWEKYAERYLNLNI